MVNIISNKAVLRLRLWFMAAQSTEYIKEDIPD